MDKIQELKNINDAYKVAKHCDHVLADKDMNELFVDLDVSCETPEQLQQICNKYDGWSTSDLESKISMKIDELD